MKTNTNFLVRASLCLAMLLLSGHATVGELESVEWIPYTTREHAQMGLNTHFSERIYLYLKHVLNLPEPQLTNAFNRWYPTNLGHVFEEAALASYSVQKNHSLYNGRVPDAVEDGLLEQITQYTHYPSSTFIEVKYMAEISWKDPRIKGQIIDMIDFLAKQEFHQTYPRYLGASFTPNPGKASEEELAILVFLTPENCIVHQYFLEYAKTSGVIIYQMKMMVNWENRQQVKLSKPEAVTNASRHLFSHVFSPKIVLMPWDRPLIDPDTGFPVAE